MKPTKSHEAPLKKQIA